MTSWKESRQEANRHNAVQCIEGYRIRPGLFEMCGAKQTAHGVSFTINSHEAESCTLLLFHPHEAEPFVKLPFPESCHIGNTYSMYVFGLRMEEFEYAFQFDGPYEPEKGKIFNKDQIILDPYARAVTGQRNWGETQKAEGTSSTKRGL